MADVESYGGKCPKCSKGMLQKFDDNGGFGGCFKYDACPWCGFAYGEVDNGIPCTEEQVWKAILTHFHVDKREDLPPKFDLT